MTLTAAVAAAYCLPIDEVRRWPAPIIATFHRAALVRGWITCQAEEAA